MMMKVDDLKPVQSGAYHVAKTKMNFLRDAQDRDTLLKILFNNR
jgi:hypothetical protein